MTAEIAPGVWQVPTTRRARDNAYLVAGDDGLTLVDVGWAAAPKVLLAAFAELGRTPRNLRRIVLTHAHPDQRDRRGQSAKRAWLSERLAA